MECTSCNNNLPLVFNVQSFMNPECSSCGDTQCYPAVNVCYTGAALPCSGIETNDDLETALTKIDEVLCSAAGDYSTYQMNGLETVYGDPIPDESTFVDAVTTYVNEVNDTINNFINNTYNTFLTENAAAIAAVDSPSITCSSAGVDPADDLATILTKYCSKFGDIDTALDVSELVSDTCFTVTTPPTSVLEYLQLLSDQMCTVKAIAEATTEGALPTFNNVGTCLGGVLTTTDTLVDTINKIKDRICALHTYDKDNLTWGCVGAPATEEMEDGFQQIIDSVNYMLPKTITVGAGLTATPTDVSDSCKGVTISVDATVDNKVAATGIDTTPGTLDSKLEGGEGVDVSFTDPTKAVISTDRKLLASDTDDEAGYLINKINGSTSNGFTITPVYNAITKKVDLILSVDTNAVCALLATCEGAIECSSYTVTPTTTSPLNYVDCEGNVVNISSISGATTVCARVNSVYAPGATIVNDGACTDAFNVLVSNNFTENGPIIANVTGVAGLAYGLEIGFLGWGDSGQGTHTGFTGNVIVQISGTFPSDVDLVLKKNGTETDRVTPISAAGTHSMISDTYAIEDVIEVIIEPTPIP